MPFQVLCTELKITEGFEKGKTRELDVDRKLLWPVNQKRDRLEAERRMGAERCGRGLANLGISTCTEDLYW